MEFLKDTLDWFLHLDKHLGALIREYGTWTYLILFLIIFAETGVVVLPLLPGDSLLFAAGMMASLGDLNVWLLILILIFGAFLGDTVNYHVGKYLGPKVFSGKVRFLKKEYLDQAQAFYEKYGGKAIIIARFVPIVRTFAPFVAGIGQMGYLRFLAYNLVGGVVWVVGLTLAGYYLAEHELVREHFEKIVIGIIFISILPAIIEVAKAKFGKKKEGDV